MSVELAFGLAANFEKVSGGTPSLDDRNGHKYVGLAVDEGVIFLAKMSSQYATGSNIVGKVWGVSTDTNTGHIVKLRLSVEALAATDLDADSFDTAVAPDSDPTGNATAGSMIEGTWTMANGAIDDLAAGGWFRLKVERISTGDTLTGDFYLGGWSFTQ